MIIAARKVFGGALRDRVGHGHLGARRSVAALPMARGAARHDVKPDRIRAADRAIVLTLFHTRPPSALLLDDADRRSHELPDTQSCRTRKSSLAGGPRAERLQ